MYLTHQTLNTNSINVYSVETDYFTLVANHLELAKPLLKFKNNTVHGEYHKQKIHIIQYIHLF